MLPPCTRARVTGRASPARCSPCPRGTTRAMTTTSCCPCLCPSYPRCNPSSAAWARCRCPPYRCAAGGCSPETGVKCMCLCSAVSSPLDRSKRFTLFLPRQTCSFRHRLGPLLEAFWPCRNYARKLFVHISNTVYSQVLICTAEWTGASGENENAQTSKR